MRDRDDAISFVKGDPRELRVEPPPPFRSRFHSSSRVRTQRPDRSFTRTPTCEIRSRLNIMRLDKTTGVYSKIYNQPSENLPFARLAMCAHAWRTDIPRNFEYDFGVCYTHGRKLTEIFTEYKNVRILKI